MQESMIHSASRTVDNIALAYFAYRGNLHDAARDLCTAGFRAEQINISTPVAESAFLTAVDRQPLVDAIGQHTFRWQVSRARAHDRQRRGADQISGLNPLPPEDFNPTCATLDLSSALNALAISEEVILLLQRDAKDKGMFMLVDAPDRVNEASAILSENAGHLRTEYLRGFSVA